MSTLMSERSRIDCPGCGRNISASMVNPMTGPWKLREHKDPATRKICSPMPDRMKNWTVK